LSEAVSLCEQSVAKQELLVRDYPLIPEYREKLANALLNLGAFQAQKQQSENATTSCERAVEHTRFLAENFGGNAFYHHLYSGALNNLVIVQKRQGRVSEELILEAIKHQHLALKDNPQNFEFRSFLLNQYFMLARVESKLNKINEAAEARQKGLEIGRALLSEQPANEAVAGVVTQLESMELPDESEEVGL
jgi:tetratricopeptide (TPR) repeat protein